MRKIVFVVLSLAFNISVFGQNFYCKEFGTASEEVVDFVLEKSDLLKVDEMDQDKISISTEGFSITYHFHLDKLYQMELRRHHEHKKDAEESFSSFLKFFTMEGAAITMETGGSHPKFTEAKSDTHYYTLEREHNKDEGHVIICNMMAKEFAPAEVQTALENSNSLHTLSATEE